MRAWTCPRCGATSRETLDAKCSADILDWCPGFVAVELGEYPDGRNVDPEKLATDSREMYDNFVQPK